MIDKFDKIQYFYCNKCGWKVSSNEIKNRNCEQKEFYYCSHCGNKLYAIENNNYSNHLLESSKFLAKCERFYEEIGSMRAVCRKLEQEGYQIDRKRLRSMLEQKFDKEGRDFEIWLSENKKYQRGVHYTDTEVETWINMYERIGSFPEISNILTNRAETGPDYKTIIKRIEERFIKEDRDFVSWKANYRRINTGHFLPNYDYSDAIEWMKLYEKQGSYRSVANIIGVGHHTIKKYISQLALKEKWNLEEWEEKYSKGCIKYNDEDIRLWIDLYEDLGSFLAISKFLEQNSEQSPDSKNIKKRLLEYFESKSWNFDEWTEFNRKEGLYTKEDVIEWKSLYEELGNFTAVSRYLHDKNGESPDPTTIKNRLKNFFSRNKWNFKKWTINFYNDNSKRHYLIGKYIHWILECLFIEFTLKHDKKGFFEIKPNRINGSMKSVDNVLLKSQFNIINIDYTISTHKKVFLNKCKKGYQSPNRRLILVSLNIDFEDDILHNKRYPYKQNVNIFNVNDFVHYIKYYGNYLENYIDAIKIMKESFTDDFFLEKLRKIAKEARLKLEKYQKLYPISQEDYELEMKWWNKNYKI